MREPRVAGATVALAASRRLKRQTDSVSQTVPTSATNPPQIGSRSIENRLSEKFSDSPTMYFTRATEFDVAHSRRHVQRLMKEAEVSWKKPRPEPASADEEDLERYDDELKKSRETG